MNRTVLAHTAEEMEELGVELADALRDGMVVSLIGELGAGKTTLVKGIAKGLLITDLVVSPSYTIYRPYQGGRLTLHHLDAYRVASLAELAEVGLDQLIPPDDGVTVIEWPERIPEIVDVSYIVVRITAREDGARRVEISTQ